MKGHVLDNGNMTPLAAYIFLVICLIGVVSVQHGDAESLRGEIRENRSITQSYADHTVEMVEQNRKLVQHNCQLDRVVLGMLSQSELSPPEQRKEALNLLTDTSCDYNRVSGPGTSLE